mmetsp:Transcript_33040/g.85698  ORF Transcript_33040/g.85698 Transcript_33040/m.85698 type:complete len:415 (+) Transcript_33040:152-1396(+)
MVPRMGQPRLTDIIPSLGPLIWQHGVTRPRTAGHCLRHTLYRAVIPRRRGMCGFPYWTSGRTPIVAATIAFGMGIDKADVRMVVHFNLPKSLEAFYQESGRAGRDGLPSFSVLYFGERDASTTRWLLTKPKGRKRSRGDGDTRQAEQAFAAVEGMAAGATCRRAAVLRHFGETAAPAPGRASTCCDACKDVEGLKARQLAARSATSRRGGWSGQLPSQVNAEEEWDTEDEDGVKRGRGPGFDLGASDGEEEEQRDPDASLAREVVQQARTAGASVLDALEKAERLYGDAGGVQPRAAGGGGSRLMERLGSGGASGSGAVPPPHAVKVVRKAGSLQLGSLREIVTGQIAQNLKSNPRVADHLTVAQMDALAAAMEEEKYHASASKPVYKSLIVGVKKHAVQCSMADLEKYMNAGA